MPSKAGVNKRSFGQERQLAGLRFRTPVEEGGAAPRRVCHLAGTHSAPGMGRLLQLAHEGEATATIRRGSRPRRAGGATRGKRVLMLNRAHSAVLHAAINAAVTLMAGHSAGIHRPWLVGPHDPLDAASAALGEAWRNSSSGTAEFTRRGAAADAFDTGHLVARGAMAGVVVLACLVVALSLTMPSAAAHGPRSR